MALFVLSASNAEAMSPTTVPLAAFSKTASVFVSVSVTADVANSLTSLMEIETV